jgi:RES domain-containing protein
MMLDRTGLRWITEPTDDDDAWRPEHVIGPFLPVGSLDISAFNGAFSDEIDSAFASSICCCDRCYQDFRDHWPEVPFRDDEFRSMEKLWAVEVSRLPGIWSPAEISTLRHAVLCDRCGEFVPYNIWVYELRFSGADEIERAVDELLTIGNQTPFLLLEHDFARQVLEHIRAAAGRGAALPAGSRLFRARGSQQVDDLGQDRDALETYAAPPAQYVTEGRFNHAGTPMLYLASTAEVATAEIGMPGESCLVAEIELLQELRLLNLVELDEMEEGYDLMQALSCSALLSAPHVGQGWQRRQYVFSRFVGDCARSAGFDAIRYGSTKSYKGTNIVLLDPAKDFGLAVRLIGVEERLGVPAVPRY